MQRSARSQSTRGTRKGPLRALGNALSDFFAFQLIPHPYSHLHAPPPRRQFSRRKFHIIAAIVLIAFVSTSLTLFNRGQASVLNLYAASCLGGWENAQLAAGEPDTEGGQLPGPLTSAVLYNQSGASIFCSGFSAPVPENTFPESAQLHLQWRIGQAETYETLDGETVTSIPEPQATTDLLDTTEAIVIEDGEIVGYEDESFEEEVDASMSEENTKASEEIKEPVEESANSESEQSVLSGENNETQPLVEEVSEESDPETITKDPESAPAETSVEEDTVETQSEETPAETTIESQTENIEVIPEPVETPEPAASLWRRLFQPGIAHAQAGEESEEAEISEEVITEPETEVSPEPEVLGEATEESIPEDPSTKSTTEESVPVEEVATEQPVSEETTEAESLDTTETATEDEVIEEIILETTESEDQIEETNDLPAQENFDEDKEVNTETGSEETPANDSEQVSNEIAEEATEPEIQEIDDTQSTAPVVDVLASYDGQEWIVLGTVGMDNWQNTSFALDIERLAAWSDLASVQISVQPHTGSLLEIEPIVYLDAMWIEVHYGDLLDYTVDFENIEETPVEDTTQIVIDPNADFLDPVNTSEHFKANETPIFELDLGAVDEYFAEQSEVIEEQVQSEESTDVTEETTTTDQLEESDDEQVVAGAFDESNSDAETIDNKGAPTADLIEGQITEPDTPELGIDQPEVLSETEVVEDLPPETPTEEDVGSDEQQPDIVSSRRPVMTEGRFFSLEKLVRRLIPQVHAQGSEEAEVVAVRVRDAQGELEPDITPSMQTAGDKLRISLVQPTEGIRPGEYTLEIDIKRGDQVFTSTQTFTLGVLVINHNLNRYLPGETVELYLAALDNQGNTLCDAPLELGVTSPTGARTIYRVSDGTINLGDDCGENNVTDEPDYWLDIDDVDLSGTYQMDLINTDTGAQLRDTFVVVGSTSLRVERSGATRINPFKSTYTMRLTVTADNDFSGKIEEQLPNNFIAISHNGARVTDRDGQQIIVWDADLTAGESMDLQYTYQAPEISPYIFNLGPVDLYDGRDLVHTEGRQWQLASDAAGDFAVWREATGTDAITTTASVLDWDTAVNVGAGFSLGGGSTRINTPGAGHYLIMYNIGVEDTGGAGRSEVQAWMDIIGGTVPGEEQVYGRSTCLVRRSDGIDECWMFGAAVYDLAVNNDIRIQTQLTDSATGTVQRMANESGVTILQLNDSWDYARIREATGGQTFNLTTWESVTWDTQDELDTGTFTHSTVTNTDQITLGTKGHYLVTANMMFQNAGTGRRGQEMRLTLDGTEIVGTRTTAYLRGQDSNQDHTAVYAGIIETTAASQVLRLQGRCNNSACSNITNVGDETGITITKLPDTADYIRLYEAVGGQAVDATADPILWDTESEEDTGSFSHDTGSNTSRIEIDHSAGTDDYLFFGTFYSARETTGVNNRQQPHWEWRLDGTTTYQYGSSAKYNRGNNTADSSGNSLGLLADGLANTSYMELINTDESTINDPLNVFEANRYAVQGVNLTTLFATNPNVRQEHFRWRPVGSGALTINANGGGDWEAAEDTGFSAVTDVGDDLRLRILVANTGTGAEAAAKTYELEFGTKATTCDAITTWTGVADAGDAFDMVAASGFTEAAATTNLLTGTGGTFQAGEGRETADTTGAVGPLAVNDFTEHEYSFEPTSSTTQGTTYCFRLYDATAGAALDSYGVYPEITMATATLDQNHFRWRNKNPSGVGLNDNAGGDWGANEDTDLSTEVFKNETVRLRVEVANTGTAAELAAKTYELQFGEKETTCAAISTWTGVGDTANDAFDMVDSADFTEGAATTAVLTTTGTFVAGEGRDTADTSGSIGPLTNGQYTELEYSFQANTAANNGAIYCFRLYDTTGAAALDTYSVYPEANIQGGLKVQKIIGSITGVTSQAETIPETLASTDNAFMLMDMSGEVNGDNVPQEAMCSGYISSTSQVTVEKSATAGTCRYAIYVVEALNGEFITRGRGSIQIDGAELTDTGAADNIGTIGDTSKTFVTANTRSDANATGEWNEHYTTTELTNATTVTSERAVNTGTDTTAVVRYEAVEWLANGVTVQTGETTLTTLGTTAQTATLGATVDTNRAFVLATFRHDTSNLSATAIQTELTSSNVSFVRGENTGYTSVARWQVIEFPSNSVEVQRGTGAPGGATNDVDITIPTAVNMERAFPVTFANINGTGTQFTRARYRSNIETPTNLNLQSGRAGGTVNYAWQVIDTSNWLPDPTLSVSISDNTIGFGGLTTAQTRYATGDTLGTTTEGAAHTITVTTNASEGYVVTVQGATLTHGNATNTIAAIGGTATALAAGTEQFGMRVTASGGLGAAEAPYDTANYAYDATGSPDIVARATAGDGVATTYSFFYGGNITGVTGGGEYSTTLVYIVTPTF